MYAFESKPLCGAESTPSCGGWRRKSHSTEVSNPEVNNELTTMI